MALKLSYLTSANSLLTWARKVVTDLNTLFAGLEIWQATTDADIDALEVDLAVAEDLITDLVDERVPIGGRALWYAATPAPNAIWLLTDGASLLVASYPELFALFGYTYGGAGANFNLPNDPATISLNTIIKVKNG